MPRLFTALELPSGVAEALSFLRGGLMGARWIPPENYHITLRFIGDVDVRTAIEISENLQRLSKPGFQVRLSGLGVFGSKVPHSIHASVESSPELLELHADHERIMKRLGISGDRRKFTPHVTLARCRGSKTVDIARYFAERGGYFSPSFEVSRFVLYSSKDSVGGGPYVLEEAYPFTEQSFAA
ncbi:MAG: RNA 2',3'-cyclic phosphodiesterase [Pseudomonadota bacterium]